MNLNLIIIDNFYSNPDSVREYALSQPFDVKGNYPGNRTKPYLTQDIKDAIQHWLEPVGGVTNWHEEYGYTGAFQLTTSIDRTWIHADHFNTWAGVCYLTPNAPHTGGTGLFRHKETGDHCKDPTSIMHDGTDYTKWDLFDVVGNKYNRLVLYRGNMYHASLDYFGNSPQNGRLFQTFFFDTQT